MDQPLGPSIDVVGQVRSTSQLHPDSLDRFSAIAVLVAFGVTWPVLQLLAENAEFFLARDSPKTEILTVALILAVVVPAAAGLLGTIRGRFGERVGLALILVAASTLGLALFDRTDMPWWGATSLAFAFGSMLTRAFHRFPMLRLAGRYLLFTPLVLMSVFLMATPAGAMLRDQGVGLGAPVSMADPVPIVFLVFDEFPIASVIDPTGNLRADRYPNLARLSGDGTWFRNAVTVEQQTEHSVPAILTGQVPDQSLTPFAGHYPDSLFSALHGVYDLRVNETITGLCPERLCEDRAPSPTPLVADILTVAGRVILPDPLADRLPEVDTTWGAFGSVPDDFDPVAEFRQNLEDDRRAPIIGLIDEIRGHRGPRPPLFFLHALVPHHPWEFLPDGRSYPLVVTANPASVQGGWNDDDYMVAQGMQRHLLQVGYVDHAIGEVISAMEDAGIYDDSVLVVVADHGIAIRPGVAHQRVITDTTVGEIAAIPLFIKAPGLATGVDDRRALTVDILPTVADAIDARIPWEMDGVSLFGQLPERTATTTIGPKGAVTFGVDGHEKLDVARRIEGWFPGGDPWSLRPPGAPDLAGEPIDVPTLEPAEISVRILAPELFQEVDTTGDVIPVRVAGRISGPAEGTEVLAVVVNGTVGTVTRAYLDDDRVYFLAMVPTHLWVDGANRIDVIQIIGEELRRVPTG